MMMKGGTNIRTSEKLKEETKEKRETFDFETLSKLESK